MTQTLAEQLSYLHYPRPFKNPNYNKNVNRRAKNLKAVLTQERERERVEREKRRQEREEKMEVDGPAEDVPEEDLPTCKWFSLISSLYSHLMLPRFVDRSATLGPATAEVL